MVVGTATTLKHSPALESDALGKPEAADAVLGVKSARQQYLPKSLKVVASDSVVVADDWSTALSSGTGVPPVAHVCTMAVGSIGPQMWNDSVPSQVWIPLTVRCAESVASTVPPTPSTSPSVGMASPFPSFGVVTTVEPHCPSWPRTKSLRVAVGDVDERVSDMTLEKHSFPSPREVRFTPPS